MAKALGFLVDDIPMCCACAEWYAHESGYPSLFFVVNHTIRMDTKTPCICGGYPDSKEALAAADRIAKLLED